MKARTFAAGGELTVKSTPGKGTVVVCSVMRGDVSQEAQG